MTRLMTKEVLQEENLVYVGTGGISQENHTAGFLPAFFDCESGVGFLSRFASGAIAPIHVLDGLPEDWVLERDAAGRVSTVKSTVIAGFIRDGYFYTREQAAQAVTH